jgi:hypothetical protein
MAGNDKTEMLVSLGRIVDIACKDTRTHELARKIVREILDFYTLENYGAQTAPGSLLPQINALLERREKEMGRISDLVEASKITPPSGPVVLGRWTLCYGTETDLRSTFGDKFPVRVFQRMYMTRARDYDSLISPSGLLRFVKSDEKFYACFENLIGDNPRKTIKTDELSENFLWRYRDYEILPFSIVTYISENRFTFELPFGEILKFTQEDTNDYPAI